MLRSRRIVFGLFALALGSCGDPSYVERITVVNRHQYDVVAEVGDGASGFLNLGGVGREDEKTIEGVIDFGERWVFRFRYPYDDAVDPIDVSITRAELEQAGWRIEVPASLAQRLREKGEQPSFSGGS
jgi:hypothetical protein